MGESELERLRQQLRGAVEAIWMRYWRSAGRRGGVSSGRRTIEDCTTMRLSRR
jgi:hypothetical protein